MIRTDIVLALFLSLGLYTGCGAEDDSNDDSETSAGTSTGTGGSASGSYTASNAVFSAADKSGPKIVPSASASLAADASWESGNVLYEIYNLIREYDDDRDNGVIDGSNMYKAIHDASKQIDSAYSNCKDLTETAVTAPFDFGTDALDHKYNCSYEPETSTSGSNTYHKSFVVNKNDDGVTYKALFGEATIEPSQTTRTIVQAQFNDSSKEVTVNQAYLVDYDSQGDYAVRLYIKGNTDSGLFTLKLSKGPGSGSGSGIAISAHGYATGDKYYLFKVSTSGYSADVTDAYYCFESSTTVDEMKAMDDAGSATIPTDCADYESGLPTTDYNADGSSAPAGTDEFTGTGDYGTTLSY